MLFVVCCVMCVACCLLFDGSWLLFADCSWLSVVCWLSVVDYCVLCVGCCLLIVVCCSLFAFLRGVMVCLLCAVC